MKNNLTKKILSAVLVLSVLFACACGNLLTASAAGETYTGTFSVTNSDGTSTIPYGSLKTEMALNFTVDNVSSYNGLAAAFVEFDMPAGVTVEEYNGVDYSVTVLDDNKTVLIDYYGEGAANRVVPITFAAPAERGFIGGDVISATVVEATTIGDALISFTAVGDASLHVHDAAGESAKCSVCDKVNVSASGKSYNNQIGICAYKVVYDTGDNLAVYLYTKNFTNENMPLVAYELVNGEFVRINWSTILNQYETDERYPMIGQSATATDAYSGVLVDGIKYYKIEGISAKDFDKTMYIVPQTGDYFGTAVELSLTSYAESVVSGQKVYYPDGTAEAEITADKRVAASLYYYGKAVKALKGSTAMEAMPSEIDALIDNTYKNAGEFATAYAAQKDVHGLNGDVALKSTDVNLTTRPIMVFDFTYDKTNAELLNTEISFSCSGTNLTKKVSELRNGYRWYLFDVPARSLCEPVTVTIGEKSGTYSAAGLAMRAANANMDDIATTVRSVVCFSEMLKARYALANQ